ncbi:tetraacyldisaccharide 4'-kinase [Prevotella sp. AM42-24]|jgi:tetraacyldisaccharide 4'-kinase|uniref:Tetraacyldisaccharide 4'-kinase n=1 Tax=Segatella hominis TaxID=2518605 RepID=A0A4Y8VPA8_9BACT|nr:MULTISPECIES: tetraacyldisaccharide 4'-kinase [Prevotellaceae]MBD8970998.1 tetraacyldisaccharide 4'-kinase [Prevotella sp.]MBD9272653.1 tetraacyldisaccharide 4'-kinase [Prevotella sp.]RGH44657.1 tetraacyldisaccharide 4'-kinase [Prevotella sp. AM42-24]TFH82429.1 tetraacyldisaccharide 4'-kinase [Segatella hominis]
MRTEGDLIKINDWLLPFSWIYGSIVRFRNWLFDMGLKKSKSFSIPIISVGNITVGGSGKTPHVEYLIRLLHDKAKIAVLSRGYKRKSHGYVLAEESTTMPEIGDEPFQMHQKFSDIYVAVDAKRARGIENLQNDEATKDVDVVLLDDAFQHRYVKPGINILLVDYHRLIIYDKMLPAGRLREPLSGKNRADIVIITKCPKDLKPMEFRVLTKAMDLYPFQKLYFTSIDYDTPKGVFEEKQIELDKLQDYHVLLLTGIASPKQMEHDLKPMTKDITNLSFGDHHSFKGKDIDRINDAFESMPEPRIIITTEKDAVRLRETEGLYEKVKSNMYELPIKVSFMLDQQDNFNEKIISYVRKNSRNSILAKRKDDNKSKDSYHSGNRSRTISFRNN